MSAVAESRERRDLLYTLKYIGVGTGGGGGQGGLCPSQNFRKGGKGPGPPNMYSATYSKVSRCYWSIDTFVAMHHTCNP